MTKHESIPKALITVQEAAKLLGVKRQTVYLWVRQGLIPCYRVGKRLIKFDKDELLASFKIERNSARAGSPKVKINVPPLAEPFRALEKTESLEAKKQKDRYRAMLGVVK
jgi:excisionase family DNA binding protein